MRLPGMLHGAVLRSPHPHARLGAIHAARASTLPGVAAVITARDLQAIGNIPVRLAPRPGLTACLQPPLARDRVRYVGEPIAFVLAESRYLAEDALDLIDVDWGPLASVADARQATTPWLATSSTGSRRSAATARPRSPAPTCACGSFSRSSATPACRSRRAGSPRRSIPARACSRSGVSPRFHTSTGASWRICSTIPSI
ncbi:MAG: hypothetical protein DMD81_27775 [Candidatus Rokuibacteriota bacterium]|nr:MAG: hypothetical protein DMD81_27775 [Candidatus Rokubacteria bacterium]